MPIASLVEDDTTILKVMSLEYTEERDSTVVHLFTRDSDGSERHLEVVGHNPSFYVQAASDGRKRRLRNDNRVVKVEDGYESIDGENLLRVEVGVPDDVPELRDNFDKTWEADVAYTDKGNDPYTDRFAIDNEIKQFISVPTEDGRISSRRIDEGTVYGDSRLHVDEITSVEKENVDWDILPRTCILDIEVERTEDGSIQSGYRPDYEITGVTVYDSYTEEYRVWVTECDKWDESFIEKYGERNETLPLEPTGESGENTLAGDSIEGFSGDSSTEIVVCESDKELLYRLNTWIGEHQPDLISGWNSEGYDIPYIIGRCNKLNEKSYVEWCRLNTLSDNAYVTRNNTAIIDGIEQFDMLDGYKRLQLHDLKSNRLEDVSKAILDDEKLTKLGDINEYQAWKEDAKTFLEYSYRDVRAVVEIDNETDIIETFDHLRSVSGAKYTECNHAFGIVDMVMLRRAYEQDLVLPTSTEPDEDWFYGGHVFQYKAGKHRNSVYPDLKSLYPYLMVMLNISPETYVGGKGELHFSKYTEDDCIRAYVDNRPVKRVESGSDYDKYKDGEYKAIQREKTDGGYTTVWVDEPEREPVYFLKPDVQQGFVSGVVEDLVDMKYEYKGQDMYSAIKVIANAVWGVFGDADTFGSGFRLFQRELAESITLAGRQVLKNTAEEFVTHVRDSGYEDTELIAGDTDSVVTKIPSASTRHEAIEVSKDACEHVNNDFYPSWVNENFNVNPENNWMEVELESYAASMFVPKDTDSDDPEKGTKKTYAQWITWDEGEETNEIEYKGLEVVRSDTANITQDVQEYVIEKILKKNTSTAKEQSYEYVREIVQDIREVKVPMSEIAKTGGISKSLNEYGTQNRRPTTKIRGAKYADKHINGENLWDGGKPMTVYVDNVEGDLPRRYSAETPEDGDLVDAVSVEEPSNIPDNVVVDYEKHVQKTVVEPLERVFAGMGWSVDEAVNGYEQTGLGEF